MPENGTYLLTNVGFSNNEKPLLLLQGGDTFIDLQPLGHTLTLRFDKRQRFCTGWRDIASGERFICPDHQSVDPKYEQCSACQKRTGFNPAFYRAVSVSPQQEARNNEPHILYLAHFGPGIIKVGISHAKRGHGRLLEQGARSALVLDTLPSAHVARHYEARISKLPGFTETVQARKKAELLTTVYDIDASARELDAAKIAIESALDVTFNNTRQRDFDDIYFPDEKPDITLAHDTSEQHMLSGRCIGQLGTFLFCRQADSILYLPLKKYVGYRIILDNTETEIQTPAKQISLF